MPSDRTHGSRRVLRNPPHVTPAFEIAEPASGDDREAEADAPDPVELARETARAEGRAEGYAEGRARAAEEAQAELVAFRREAVESIERLVRLEQTLTKRHEAKLLEIVIEAASAVVRERLEAGDPVARRALEQALAVLPEARAFQVRLNPADREPVAELLAAEIAAERVQLTEDPELSRGGIVVESEAGRIDATLETAERHVSGAILGDEEGA